MKLKKGLSMLLTTAMLFAATGCSSSGGDSADSKYVGVAMPTKSSARWINDGNTMKEEFEKIGYKVDLQYAEDVIENQVSQIENQIQKLI